MSITMVQIGDSTLIEPVNFNIALRLQADSVVATGGTVSSGEFGRLFVDNKTIEQRDLETQQQIDLQAEKNHS